MVHSQRTLSVLVFYFSPLRKRNKQSFWTSRLLICLQKCNISVHERVKKTCLCGPYEPWIISWT